MIEYNGYVGRVEYDSDIESLFGEVINSRDVITFYGASVAELKREMARSVDTYLEVCAERGIEPEKPFRGDFLVRADPQLHRELALAAAAEHESLNSYVVKRLSMAVAESRPADSAIGTRSTRTKTTRKGAGSGRARKRSAPRGNEPSDR